MIADTIDINAGPAIEQLNALAEAAARAEAAVGKLKAAPVSSAGADKLAASMDKAAASIEAAAQRASAAMGRLSTASRGATGGLDAVGTSANEAAAASDRLAGSADAGAAALERQAVAGTRAGRAHAEAAASGEKFWKGVKVLAVGGAVAAAYGIDKAMQLQSEVTRLYTAAGLKGVKPADVTAATLAIGSKTGFSGRTIAEAMYHPVSAGLDWKTTQGLTQQSANLSNIHGANLDDTTYALSSVMKAYNLGAKQVTPTAALLNSIVGQGDMRFQDFNQSVKNFAPTGASMGISLQSMGAGLAYLTDRGNSAEVASTRLTMGLSMATAGSKAANTYMRDLGLTTGKLDLQNKSLQKTMEAGGLTTNKFASDLKKPDGLYVALSDMQGAFHKAGLSAGQADQVMAKIFGGGRSDKAIVSLMQNLDGVRQKYEQIGQGVKGYGKSVADEQATAQQKWKDFLASGQNLATGFGNAMLPAFTKITTMGAGLLQGHGGAVAGVLGGAAALFTGKKLVSGVESTVKTGETALRGVGRVAQVLHIPGLDKLANLGKNSAAGTMADAAAGNQRAASTMAEAAGGMQRAADTMAGASGEGRLGAGAKARRAAAGAEAGAAGAEGEAAAGGAGASRFKGAGMTAALGALGALTIVDPILKSMKSGPGGKNWLDNPFGMAGPNDPRSKNNWLTSFSPYERLFNTGKAPAPPSAVAASGAPSPGFAARFGPPGATGKVTPEVDTSKAKSALSGFTSMLATAMHKPVKLPPPDISALTAAKGKAQAAGQGITQALTQAMHKPVKLPPPDLSAASSAAGKARGIGASISGGLASGIEAGKPGVVAAATDVGNAAAAAMAHAAQTHSPSRKTIKTGKDIAAGLVVGLEGGKAAVDAAATALGKNAAKAADIASIDSTAKKLLADVPKGDSGLTKMLKADQGKLTSLANQRSKLEAEITNAQDIAKTAISNANITGAAGYQPVLAASSGPLAASATISGMQSMAADQKQFASTIAQLKKQGLNATSLTQITQAGPSALPMALGLAQGGKGAIQQVNALEQQIHSSAAKLGSTAAGPMFQAGVDAGKGLAQGIKSQLGAVDAAMKQLAQHMVNAVKKALKSHSPSLVFADIGLGIPQGLAQGVDAGSAIAASAVSRMGQRAAGGWHPGAYGHAGGGHGGGGSAVIHVHNNVTVMGHVTAEHDLLDRMQELQLAKADRNWQGGWQHPGRAG